MKAVFMAFVAITANQIGSYRLLKQMVLPNQVQTAGFAVRFDD